MSQNTHRIAFAIIGLLIGSVCSAQTTEMIFASVPWGSSRAQTKQKIVEAGFQFENQDKDGDLRFSGQMPMLNEKAVIFAFFAPSDQLVKIQVTIVPPDDRTLDVYRTIKQSLTEKYGKPSPDIEHYSYPYDDDGGAVGHETTAIQFGKGVVTSLWGGSETGGIGLKVTDKLTDELVYESSGWPDEFARRKKATNLY
jgi:hypothetical protein